MKISKRIFIYVLLSLFVFLITWLHAYDVFYENSASSLFGGDSVTYLFLKYKLDNLESLLKAAREVGLGSVFGTFGINLLSKFINNIFGSWALFGSILINLFFVFISYIILEKAYSKYLFRFKKNLLILTYLFPAILIYVVGPNKEIFTFMISCILVRISIILSSSNNKFHNHKYEVLIYFIFMISITIFREIYLGITILLIPLFTYKSNIMRYSILYLSSIALYFIKPEEYYGNVYMLQQQSSVILIQLEKYFDSAFTFVLQIIGRYIVSVSGVLYPTRLSLILEGHAFQAIRILFFLLITTILFLSFKVKNMMLRKIEFSQLTNNLLYCLVIISFLFSLSNYNNDRKIIPTYPLAFALIASIINDRNKLKTNFSEDLKL